MTITLKGEHGLGVPLSLFRKAEIKPGDQIEIVARPGVILIFKANPDRAKHHDC